MATQSSIFNELPPFRPTGSAQPSDHHFICSLHDPLRCNAGIMEKLFLPFAGAMYVHRPSKRRLVLNRAVDKLEESCLPGYEYVIAHLYDKYRRNLTISTISQTGQTSADITAKATPAGLNYLCHPREGAPYLSTTYLAHFRSLFHHLL